MDSSPLSDLPEDFPRLAMEQVNQVCSGLQPVITTFYQLGKFDEFGVRLALSNWNDLLADWGQMPDFPLLDSFVKSEAAMQEAYKIASRIQVWHEAAEAFSRSQDYLDGLTFKVRCDDLIESVTLWLKLLGAQVDLNLPPVQVDPDAYRLAFKLVCQAMGFVNPDLNPTSVYLKTVGATWNQTLLNFEPMPMVDVGFQAFKANAHSKEEWARVVYNLANWAEAGRSYLDKPQLRRLSILRVRTRQLIRAWCLWLLRLGLRDLYPTYDLAYLNLKEARKAAEASKALAKEAAELWGKVQPAPELVATLPPEKKQALVEGLGDWARGVGAKPGSASSAPTPEEAAIRSRAARAARSSRFVTQRNAGGRVPAPPLTCTSQHGLSVPTPEAASTRKLLQPEYQQALLEGLHDYETHQAVQLIPGATDAKRGQALLELLHDEETEQGTFDLIRDATDTELLAAAELELSTAQEHRREADRPADSAAHAKELEKDAAAADYAFELHASLIAELERRKGSAPAYTFTHDPLLQLERDLTVALEVSGLLDEINKALQNAVNGWRSVVNAHQGTPQPGGLADLIKKGRLFLADLIVFMNVVWDRGYRMRPDALELAAPAPYAWSHLLAARCEAEGLEQLQIVGAGLEELVKLIGKPGYQGIYRATVDALYRWAAINQKRYAEGSQHGDSLDQLLAFAWPTPVDGQLVANFLAHPEEISPVYVTNLLGAGRRLLTHHAKGPLTAPMKEEVRQFEALFGRLYASAAEALCKPEAFSASVTAQPLSADGLEWDAPPAPAPQMAALQSDADGEFVFTPMIPEDSTQLSYADWCELVRTHADKGHLALQKVIMFQENLNHHKRMLELATDADRALYEHDIKQTMALAEPAWKTLCEYEALKSIWMLMCPFHSGNAVRALTGGGPPSMSSTGLGSGSSASEQSPTTTDKALADAAESLTSAFARSDSNLPSAFLSDSELLGWPEMPILDRTDPQQCMAAVRMELGLEPVDIVLEALEAPCELLQVESAVDGVEFFGLLDEVAAFEGELEELSELPAMAVEPLPEASPVVAVELAPEASPVVAVELAPEASPIRSDAPVFRVRFEGVARCRQTWLGGLLRIGG